MIWGFNYDSNIDPNSRRSLGMLLSNPHLVVKRRFAVVNGESDVFAKTNKGAEHRGISTLYRSDLNLLARFQDLFYSFCDILQMVFAHPIGSSTHSIQSSRTERVKLCTCNRAQI